MNVDSCKQAKNTMFREEKISLYVKSGLRRCTLSASVLWITYLFVYYYIIKLSIESLFFGGPQQGFQQGARAGTVGGPLMPVPNPVCTTGECQCVNVLLPGFLGQSLYCYASFRNIYSTQT